MPVPIRRKLLSAGGALTIAGIAALASIPIVGSFTAGAESEHHKAEVLHGSFAMELTAPSGALAWAHAMAVAQAAQYVEALRAAEYAQAHRRIRRAGGSRCGSNFECFKACTTSRESHGDYGAVSSSGTYRGAYQFSQQTWTANGGTGDPATATPQQQDAVAYNTWQSRGTQPWGGMC